MGSQKWPLVFDDYKKSFDVLAFKATRFSACHRYGNTLTAAGVQRLHTLSSSLQTRAENRPYGKASPFSCVLSIPPPILTPHPQHTALMHTGKETGSELAGNDERQHKRRAGNKSFLCASRPVDLQLTGCFVF
ncbi:unnamed protein product [Pleuronectes platessa]|uniref:Uncharacterized protein n=1 Tax=Pleuronectes platessa TaxID=8262 RepID=A0A9N7V8R4_PLEPL|nr:unnamed protein product [Pleuronectes platessa]